MCEIREEKEVDDFQRISITNKMFGVNQSKESHHIMNAL